MTAASRTSTIQLLESLQALYFRLNNLELACEGIEGVVDADVGLHEFFEVGEGHGFGFGGVVVFLLDEVHLGLVRGIDLAEAPVLFVFEEVELAGLFDSFEALIHLSLLAVDDAGHFGELFGLDFDF